MPFLCLVGGYTTFNNNYYISITIYRSTSENVINLSSNILI